MHQTIAAVFDAGVFRPLQPVEFADGTRVIVQVQEGAVPVSGEVDEETRRAWVNYLDRMESLEDASPQDGLTNRDHDRVIYGG
jgi:predicted DNA-binding antitoxin AbrB/MazE fold protein